MQTDNDPGKTSNSLGVDIEDEGSEKGLQWLLDMDLSEPEETLFTVKSDEYVDQGLSAFEAEVANRPLVRGSGQGDDLASYVGEEIVMSSDGSSAVHDEELDDDNSDEESGDSGAMAVDYSLGRSGASGAATVTVDEGADILGLSADDDIGDKHVSIKRVKTTAKSDSDATNVSLSPDVSSTESSTTSQEALVVDAEDIAQMSLTDAPTPSQVVDPSCDDVANEAPQASASTDFDTIKGLSDDPVFDESVFDESTEVLATTIDESALDAGVIDIEGVGEEEAISLADADQNIGSEDEILSEIVDEDVQGNIASVSSKDPLQGAPTLADAAVLLHGRSDSVSAEDAPVAVDSTAIEDADAVSVEGSASSIADAELTFDSSSLTPDAFDDEDLTLDWDDGVNDSVEVIASVASDEVSTEAVLDELDSLDDFAFAVDDGESDVELLADAIDESRIDDDLEALVAAGTEETGSSLEELPNLEVVGGVSEDFAEVEDIFGEDLDEDFTGEFVAQLSSEEDDSVDIESAFADSSFEDNVEERQVDSEIDVAAEAVTETEPRLESEILREELLSGYRLDTSVEDVVIDEPEAIEPISVFEGDVTADTEDDVLAVSDESPAGTDSLSESVFEVECVAEVEAPAEPIDDPQQDEVEDSLVEDVTASEAVVEEDSAEEIAAESNHSTDDQPWYLPEAIAFDYTNGNSGEVFADFIDAFVEEGSSEVEKLETLVAQWEQDINDESVIADVCRTLHTVKGIAKGVGLQRMGTLVHNFETLVDKLPRSEAGGEESYFRIVNVWLDAVVRGIDHVSDQRSDILSEVPQLKKASSSVVDLSQESIDVQSPVVETSEGTDDGLDSQSLATQEETDSSSCEDVVSETIEEPADEETLAMRESVRQALEKKRDKQLADEGAKALAAQQSVRITSEKLDLMLNLASQAQQLGVRASQNTTRSKRSTGELQGRLTSVRTHIGKIADRALMTVNARAGGSAEMDALEMDQYSELQEAASILREGVEDLSDLIDVVTRQNAQIEALLKQQSSVISSISSSIQGARVMPVSRLMPGLRRIVRTVSTDLDKSVSFSVLNETGALDRDHFSRLQTALEHMVRNALDHGIESSEQRLAAGKPLGGRITIDVRKSGGDYIVCLSDDGKGIDVDAIRQSAYEKGLDVDVDELSDDEAMRLIFHKGFSTASELSETSGRGVGMDIVLTELQQIGGDVQIHSTVGQGTTFEIRIPSNVSVNGALLVAAADQSYAVPLNGLVAVEQVPVADFFAAVDQGHSLSLFDLECEPAYLGTLCHGTGLPEKTFWDAFVPVIIAGSGDRHMAIAIDNVEEALELVVRSLGSQFSTVPGVAGAATTADGEALVALDLNLLVDSIGADGVAAVAAVEQETSQSLLALVVDDSRTQRMVATSQLDSVGIESVTAENGLVAIDLLNAAHRLPDVVLLDVEMPVKDGIETLREIRKSRRYGHLPVIMVTSRTGTKHRALAKEAGCNAYMGKPFNFPALIEQISDLTGQAVELS